VTATGALAPARRADTTSAIRITAFAALILLRIVAVVVVLDTPGSYEKGTAFRFDSQRYHHIAEQPGDPYRDFSVEYPPGTLAFIEVVNGPTVDSTIQNLAVASLALDLIAACGVAYGWGRRGAAAYLVLGLPFLLLPFIYFRVDLLSVALAIWGLALVKRRSEAAGGVILAVAVFAKLWPIALIPMFVVQRKWRALSAFAVAGLVGGGAWLAWSGTAGPEQVLTFRGASGWNVESVAGGIVRIVSGGTIFREAGAIRTGQVPSWGSPVLGLALVAIVACIWWQVNCNRSRDEGLTFGVAPVVAICAFLVCSPVLSPQYVVWLLPFGAVCWVTGQRRMAQLIGCVVVVTMLLTRTYPGWRDAEVLTYAVLTMRNVLLIVIMGYGFALARRPRAQSTFSGADGAPLMSSMR